MSVSKTLGRIHSRLSGYPPLVRAAVKVRNQANAIVATHFSRLSVSSECSANGERQLAEYLAPHARNFVDVGGNQGEWSAHFLRHARGAPAGLIFEPGRECAEALKARFEAWPNVEVVTAAVADYSGDAEFFEGGIDDQISSLTAANAGCVMARRVVPVVSLDEQFAKRGWDRVSFVKVDAEGHDYFVLRGARRWLQQRKIDVIQFECNSTWGPTGTTLRGPVNFLQSFGYCTYHLRPNGLFSVDFESFGNDFGYGNWVAFHDEIAQLLRPLLHS